MKMVRIVIPLYKVDFDNSEKMSLQRSLIVLKNHAFSIVCPEGLDISSIAHMFEGLDYDIRRFDPTFFKGISGYNQLMLSQVFYQAFSDYKYILICQTDVFVFSDQLLFWCEKDYDYIGAPWIASPQNALNKILFLIGNFFRKKKKSQHHFFKVGNGGFSLRKVETMQRVVTQLKDKIDFFLRNRDARQYYQEDVFISLYAPTQIQGIKIPEYIEAMGFAMDRKPHLAYAMNNYQLPFACHGFNKPKVRKFWEPILAGHG